jgi:hypothetical protein
MRALAARRHRRPLLGERASTWPPSATRPGDRFVANAVVSSDDVELSKAVVRGGVLEWRAESNRGDAAGLLGPGAAPTHGYMVEISQPSALSLLVRHRSVLVALPDPASQATAKVSTLAARGWQTARPTRAETPSSVGTSTGLAGRGCRQIRRPDTVEIQASRRGARRFTAGTTRLG